MRILLMGLFWSSTILLGIATLYWGTDRWQAFTAEAARRISVSKNPLPIKNYDVIRHNGQQSRLYPDEPRLVLMELIFTKCPTVCIAMGANFRELQNEIIKKGIRDHVNLLSISFDSKDSYDDLKRYLEQFSADFEIWTAAKFKSKSDLENMMKKIGAIAIPEPTLGYVHNSVVYVVSNGEISAMYDHDDLKGILAEIDSLLIPKRT